MYQPERGQVEPDPGRLPRRYRPRGDPLLEAAASLAQDEYPELDVQQLLGDVDQLLARLKRRLPLYTTSATQSPRGTKSTCAVVLPTTAKS
jgi:hypothetical protein